MEKLDPTSIRARYREFLQAMARQGNDMQRKIDETPSEYQYRLLEFARKHYHGHEDDEQASSMFLADLTQAYNRERYGGENGEWSIDAQHRETLLSYLPQFTRHLAPKETKQKSPVWSAEKARWGED
jgi:hypothetical protein